MLSAGAHLVANNAPSTILDARTEIKNVEVALQSLQRYLGHLDPVSPHEELISLDELLVTLSRLRTKIMWFRYSKRIEECIVKAQRHKTSLTMMLSILQCESDLEASQSQESLQTLVEQILLVGNEQLKDSFDARSTLACDNDTIRPKDTSMRDDMSTIAGIRPSNTVQSLSAFAFDSVLKQSRVYKKSERNIDCDCSFVTSAMRSHAWSILSGYSLAGISVLSVVAMPVTIVDITNGTSYILRLLEHQSKDNPELSTTLSGRMTAS